MASDETETLHAIDLEAPVGGPPPTERRHAAAGSHHDTQEVAPPAVPDVVIDLTDATLARHGGPVVELPARVSPQVDPAPAAAPTGPARSALATLAGSPLALLLTVNVLNVLDAALTVLWIEMGIALEANPVVDAIGFPAKVVAVAIGSYVVYRLRPRWLLVPIAALAAVCVYHVVGAAVVLAWLG